MTNHATSPNQADTHANAIHRHHRRTDASIALFLLVANALAPAVSAETNPIELANCPSVSCEKTLLEIASARANTATPSTVAGIAASGHSRTPDLEYKLKR